MVVQSARSLLQAIRLAIKHGVRANPTPAQSANRFATTARIKAVPQRVNQPQFTIKLNPKFTQLLNHLSSNPVWKGARNVFISSAHSPTATPSSPILRNLSRHPNAFKPNARFSNGGFRVNPAPIRPSMRNGGGLGLGTARNFSSGTGGRGLDLIITNAPLALRALGNELLEKEGKGHGKEKGFSSRGIRRLGNRGVKHSQALALERSLRSSSTSIQLPTLKSATISHVEKEDREASISPSASSSIHIQIQPLATREEIRSEYNRYWRPSSITNQDPEEGPHEGLQTVLHLALDPNLSSILIRKPLHQPTSNHLIDQFFLDSLVDLQDLFRSYKAFLSTLLRSLREMKVLKSYDPVLLAYENFRGEEEDGNQSLLSNSSFCLEIEFKGWKKQEILEMLEARIGKEMVEDFRNLMLFVERKEPQVQETSEVGGTVEFGSVDDHSLNQAHSEHLGRSISLSRLSQSQSQDMGSQQIGSSDDPSVQSSTFIMPTIPIEIDQPFESIEHQYQSVIDSNHSDESLPGSNLSSPSSTFSSLADSMASDFGSDGEIEQEIGIEIGDDSMMESRIDY